MNHFILTGMTVATLSATVMLGTATSVTTEERGPSEAASDARSNSLDLSGPLASGGGFDIPRYRIAAGGETFSVGADFSLGGTIGQHEAGVMDGGDYTLAGGFWAGGPDASEPKCSIPADLNCDGVVDVSDLLILLGQWGSCARPGDCAADLNDDGVVDVSDLLILLGNWGS